MLANARKDHSLPLMLDVVCMKVRFEAKVTRGFSLSPRRFHGWLSPLSGLLSLSRRKIKKNLWDQGKVGPKRKLVPSTPRLSFWTV